MFDFKVTFEQKIVWYSTLKHFLKFYTQMNCNVFIPVYFIQMFSKQKSHNDTKCFQKLSIPELFKKTVDLLKLTKWGRKIPLKLSDLQYAPLGTN